MGLRAESQSLLSLPQQVGVHKDMMVAVGSLLHLKCCTFYSNRFRSSGYTLLNNHLLRTAFNVQTSPSTGMTYYLDCSKSRIKGSNWGGALLVSPPATSGLLRGQTGSGDGGHEILISAVKSQSTLLGYMSNSFLMAASAVALIF